MNIEHSIGRKKIYVKDFFHYVMQFASVIFLSQHIGREWILNMKLCCDRGHTFHLLLFVFFLFPIFNSTVISAQFCEGNPPPAETVNEVELLCEGLDALNEYCFWLQPASCDTSIFPGGCDPISYVLNNPNWFGFVAGADEVSLVINIDSCQNTGGALGAQFALYEAVGQIGPTPECKPYLLPLEVVQSGSLPECNCRIGELTYTDIPTTIGSTYYLVFDGCAGDSCQIRISVIAGGSPPAIVAADSIHIPSSGFEMPINGASDTICSGATDVLISSEYLENASSYLWTLPDGSQVITDDPQLLYDFPDDPGAVFSFCLQGRNDCDTADIVFCDTVVLGLLDTIYNVPLFLCEGESVIYLGTTIGPYNNLTRDTMIEVVLIVQDPAFYFCNRPMVVDVFVSEISNCDCDKESGEMSTIFSSYCAGDTVRIIHDKNNLYLGADDSLRYVVHTSSDTILGDIALTSRDSFFIMSDLLDCDSTYYISAVVGQWSGTAILLNDPCLDVAAGQPIQHRCAPVVFAGRDTTICDNLVVLRGQSSVGAGIWSSLTAGAAIDVIDIERAEIAFAMPGTYQLQFISTDGTGCIGRDTITVFYVESPTAVRATVDTFCTSSGNYYTVSFTIQGGDPGTYQVNGNAVNSNIFISDSIMSGEQFLFVISDTNECATDTVAGSFICECLSSIGDLIPAELNLCSADTLEAATYYDPAGQVIVGNDIRNYILFTDDGDFRNSAIQKNTTGEFVFDDLTMNYGQPYLVVLVIGNPLSADTVHLDDVCLLVSDQLQISMA